MTDVDELDEVELVTVWRADRLVRLGVDADHAFELAESEIDVHSFEKLVGDGCTKELAERILR